MKTLSFRVIIPARLRSTRLPGKMLADIAGKPMVAWVAERAAESGAEEVVVATDHADIADAMAALGWRVCTTSPSHATGTDRLAEAVELLRLPDDEIVVNVQGDEPLIPPPLVRSVAARLAASPDAAIATAAHPIHDPEDWRNPNVVKAVLDREGRALLFSRAAIPFDRDGSEPVPACALRHIGLYAYRVGFLLAYPTLERAPIEALESLEQLRALWHGYRIVVEVTDEQPPPGVDTPADLERVRRIVSGGHPN